MLARRTARRDRSSHRGQEAVKAGVRRRLPVGPGEGSWALTASITGPSVPVGSSLASTSGPSRSRSPDSPDAVIAGEEKRHPPADESARPRPGSTGPGAPPPPTAPASPELSGQNFRRRTTTVCVRASRVGHHPKQPLRAAGRSGGRRIAGRAPASARLLSRSGDGRDPAHRRLDAGDARRLRTAADRRAPGDRIRAGHVRTGRIRAERSRAEHARSRRGCSLLRRGRADRTAVASPPSVRTAASRRPAVRSSRTRPDRHTAGTSALPRCPRRVLRRRRAGASGRVADLIGTSPCSHDVSPRRPISPAPVPTIGRPPDTAPAAGEARHEPTPAHRAVHARGPVDGRRRTSSAHPGRPRAGSCPTGRSFSSPPR